MFVFTIGCSTDAFLLLRASQIGVAAVWIPILWAGHNLVRAVTSTPGGHLSDHVGRKPLIVAGWAVYAAVYLLFAFATEAWQAWFVLLAYGLYFGLVEGAEKAFVADLVPAERCGAAFGWFNFVVGVGAPAAVAPIQGGLAPWQARKLRKHIDENLDMTLTTAVLGDLVALSASYQLGAFKPMVLYSHRGRVYMDGQHLNWSANQWAAGVEYTLSKRSLLQAGYGAVRQNAGGQSALAWSKSSASTAWVSDNSPSCWAAPLVLVPKSCASVSKVARPRFRPASSAPSTRTSNQASIERDTN